MAPLGNIKRLDFLLVHEPRDFWFEDPQLLLLYSQS